MSSRLAVVALLGVVSACQCGGGAPPGAKYRFTSEGEGPTNAAPLNPLRVGSVLGEGVDTTIIDGVIETPSGRELRMTRVFSNLVTRVTQAPDGLFFTGSTADGTAPTAASTRTTGSIRRRGRSSITLPRTWIRCATRTHPTAACGAWCWTPRPGSWRR
jgi:hypothetical protein